MLIYFKIITAVVFVYSSILAVELMAVWFTMATIATLRLTRRPNKMDIPEQPKMTNKKRYFTATTIFIY
jgi:hypothetical protein